MKNKKYIIFDMDGTLIDSSKLLANTINYVRQNLALPKMEDKVILEAINDPSVNAPIFFYESEYFEEFHQEFFQEYYQENYKKDAQLYDGIKELIEKLSRTHKLSIATNAYKKSTSSILFSLGIEHYFDIVVCADEVKEAKPAPDMINLITNFYEDSLDNFVLVGDSEKDLESAQNANIDSILVEWGFSSHDNSINSVSELTNLLYS